MFLGVMVLITMVDPRWRLSNKSLMTLCTTHPLARLINYPQWPELCATSAACQACRVCQQKLRGPLHTRWSGWNDLVTVMVPWFILSLLSPPSPSFKFTTSSFQTSYNIKMASNLCDIYYLCCPWIVGICKVAEDGAGYVITKSDDLYMGSVTATLAHQVQTFCLLFTPSLFKAHNQCCFVSCAEEPSEQGLGNRLHHLG